MSRLSVSNMSLGILLFVTILSGWILTGNYSEAVGDKTRGDEEVSCTLSYSVGDDHEISRPAGQYIADIGTTDFGATCSDEAGFVMYAAGFSKDLFGNNKMVGYFVDGYDSEFDIESGIATSGDTSNWAMKVSTLPGDYAPTIENGFGSYRTIPTDYTRMVSFDGSTNELPSMVRINYAVYVSANQMVGTYTGKVRYVLVHPQDAEAPLHPEVCPGDGNICYIPNAKNVVGKVAAQSASIGENTLRTSNFKRAGYGFAGWNTEYDYSGTTYGPNETITISDFLDEAGLPLYAVWVKSSGSLQNWNGCYELSVGDVIALTDQRDNQTYAISKLADGKCWMIENLRLSDDANNEAMSQGYGGKFAGLPESQYSEEFRDDATPYNSLYYYDIDEQDDYHGEATIDIGLDDYPNTRLPRYNSNNTTWQADTAEEPTNNYYGYGHYYNWPAAIANTSLFEKNNSYTTTSICPTGWRLPMGGDKNGESVNEYWNLIVESLNNNTLPSNYGAQETPYYSGNTETKTASELIRAYPNNFIKSGKYEGGNHVDPGDSGMYWSSISGQNEVAYGLYFDETLLYPGTKAEMKYNGGTIRCITTSEEYQTVTVNFDDGVSNVVIHSNELGKRVVETSGSEIKLAKNHVYFISANYKSERGFSNWSTTENGDIGTALSPQATYRVTGPATLTLNTKRVCVAGHICYDKNYDGESTSGGGMKNQEADPNYQSDILWNSNFARDGYGFAGWNTEPNGNGTTYGPNETLYYDSKLAQRVQESGLMLYAVWVQSEGYLQSFTCPNNTTMPLGTVKALTDKRDNQVYTVAKLADGKCWMTENLRLNSEYTVGSNINDSNVTNESLSQRYEKSDVFGNFIGLAGTESGTFRYVTDSNSLYATDDSKTINIGNANDAPNRMPRYNNHNTSEPGYNMDGFLQSGVVYRHGNYYSGTAAIASTRYYNIGDSVETSVCPVGWRLPTGGKQAYSSDGEFYALAKTIMDGMEPNVDLSDRVGYEGVVENIDVGVEASNGMRRYPNNFTLSGDISGSDTAPGNQGILGAYWSSTVGSNDRLQFFALELNNNSVLSAVPIQTYIGQSVRCVAEPTKTIPNITYMQDFAGLSAQQLEAVKNSMAEGDQYQLIDERDDKTYYISKLADGNIWMTQNLDFDIVNGGADIDSSNTDVPDDWADAGLLVDTYPLGHHGWDSADYIHPKSVEPGDLCWDGSIGFDDNDDWERRTLACSDRHYHVGNFYNWSAAVAMADTSKYDDEEDEPADAYADTDQSICPAGWMLPKDGVEHGSGTFEYLINQQNLTAGEFGNIHRYPTYFTYTGDWYGFPDYTGDTGYYYSSVINGDAVSMEFSEYGDVSTNVWGRSDGLSLRCLVRTSNPIGIGELDYMQDFASLSEDEKTAVLDSMSEGGQYQLKDSRDNKRYYVSKLADGNIWMTQNLDFDIVNGGANINSTNTNVPADWSDAGNLANTRTSDDTGWIMSTTAPQSYDAGDLCWRDDDSVPCADNLQNRANRSHLGNYYNWTAAVAMSDSSSYTTEGTDVRQSICPAGWTLPKGGVEPRANSFANLIVQQNLTSGYSGNAYKMPTYFTYGGAWEGGNLNQLDVGSVAMYHSSTIISDYTTFRFPLYMSNSGAPVIDGFYRGTGYSIRCIMKSSNEIEDIHDLNSMQDFASLENTEKAAVLDSMVEGEQYQLTDSRDDKVYYISKLADGNVWMTQNLDFDIVNGGADINSTNTDVPANWTGAGHLNNTYATEHDSWERLGRYSESYDAGDLCWDGSIGFNDDAEWYQYTIPCTDRHYHVGNYYNWTAAVALEDSSMYFASEESTGNDNVDVDQSICPAGWMLPKDGISSGSGSYEYLVNQQHLTDGASGNIHQAPTYFIYGGRHYGGIPDYFGGEGLYITSVFLPDYYNSTGNMTFGENGEEPIQFNVVHGNDDGYTIRCLVRK